MSWKNEKEELGKEITEMLYDNGMIKTWYKDNSDGWFLISGLWSPFYIQLRTMCSFPYIIKKTGYGIGKIVQEETDSNKVVGIASAGVPLAIAATTETGIPSLYTRKLEGVKTVEQFYKKIKEYGEHSLVEGIIENNDNLGLVDDLVTKFDSKLIALEQVKCEVIKRDKENIKLNDVIVLFDREQGASETAEEAGMNLHSLIPFRSKALRWLKSKMEKEEHKIITDYLRDPTQYQDSNVQKELKELVIG